MARLYKFEVSKTYASEANAIKAVEKLYGHINELKYFVNTTPEGRFFPVFIGVNAIRYGVPMHFHVVG